MNFKKYEIADKEFHQKFSSNNFQATSKLIQYQKIITEIMQNGSLSVFVVQTKINLLHFVAFIEI